MFVLYIGKVVNGWRDPRRVTGLKVGLATSMPEFPSYGFCAGAPAGILYILITRKWHFQVNLGFYMVKALICDFNVV